MNDLVVKNPGAVGIHSHLEIRTVLSLGGKINQVSFAVKMSDREKVAAPKEKPIYSPTGKGEITFT